MEQLWFTRILNALFAKPVVAVMAMLHLHPAHIEAPISNPVAMEIFVALLLLLMGIGVGSSLSVEKPGAFQHLFEWVWIWLGDHSEEVIGHHGRRFIRFLATLFLFILIANLLGLVPGFESPTQEVTIPLGLAVVAFVYYHWQGIRQLGVGHYLKQFMGPIPAMAPLMIPIEIISHLARVLSLTVRLYANMFAGELITMIIVALVPVAGVLFMGLHLFVGILQAYIFLVLAMVYLSGAVAEEH